MKIKVIIYKINKLGRYNIGGHKLNKNMFAKKLLDGRFRIQ